MSLTIIFLVIMFIFVGRVLYKKSTSRSSCPLPPGPTPLPFFGCAIQMLLNKPTFRWIDKLMDQFDTPILCLRLGPSTHVIVVSSPDIACEFLKKQDEIFMSRPDVLSAYLISGGYRTAVMSPYGEQWRKMKRVINRDILSPPIQKWLQPKRDEEADQVLRYICNQIEKQDSIVDGASINVRALSQHFFANTMRNIIFGKRFFGQGTEDGGPGEEETEHVAALFVLLKYLYAFCITDYFPWLRGKTDFDGHEKIIRTAIENVRKYHDPLVDERIQMWNNGDRKEKSDILDVLITLENPKLTPEEIKAEIVELMMATIDNTYNAVEWTIGEMINEPMILKRAVEELEHIVGHQRLVEEHDVPQLNYIKACIKEAFRLHPFVSFLPPHVSMMDTTVAGYFIPKGSHVILSRYGVGRNPNVWADPLRFNPDRHLHGEEKHVVLSDNNLRLISFSTGKRGCPGIMLGTIMTTMLLARMVQGFTWEAPDNERSVELVESHDDICLATPLVAIAKPRLPGYMYPTY
ncbi:putative tyrosine N-monooxygenase [Helianthus annuus]|uniref:Tyrosine N-monooxygenase n=1 Tax=Helianthus annuus TaxID=4232 RepID=A0A251UWI1_HELAN|nr:valine N-monooxygenase 1 [Helianthus annuus]KAF5803296.1 putative tyrosine N-monooxygenase [Helianthus annuus]KAJ0567886.1 putative tyrosine N-monooxygenase [Helianthus annuus]KAJ0574330.1 putative tyrosine N-monooxygenase [Helianthus annuus]KAJ0738666.1 putative tyrosine N-monooxygenase [Helianthus annuus]KAJ0741553.1 putative tyrosine N-monooxygenase [Helianthus annuus]